MELLQGSKNVYEVCESITREVSADLVLRWKEEVLKVQGLKVRTRNNKVAHMRALFNFAIKKKLFREENPFNGVVACPGVKRKNTF